VIGSVPLGADPWEGEAVLSAEASSWAPLNLANLESREARHPDLGGSGMLYPGLRHLLSGEPESGKTFLARAVALDLRRANKGVVWVDLEGVDEYAAEEQFRCLGATDDDLSQLAYISPAEPIGTEGVADSIAETLALYKPALVVFDAFVGLLDLHGLDGWKSADVEHAYRLVVGPWRAQGAAVLIIDHVVKAKGDRGRFASGSERKLGAVDVHLGLDNVKPFGRGRQGRSKILVHKDRAGWLHRPRLGDFILESDDDGCNITWEIEPPADDTAESGTGFRPTVLMERVSIYMETLGEPASRKQIETAVTGKGEWIRHAIDVLLAEGHLTDAPGRGKPVVHAKPFRNSSSSEVVPNSSQDGSANSSLVPGPIAGTRTDTEDTDPEDEELERLAAVTTSALHSASSRSEAP
jgi:hypothetical protein